MFSSQPYDVANWLDALTTRVNEFYKTNNMFTVCSSTRIYMQSSSKLFLTIIQHTSSLLVDLRRLQLVSNVICIQEEDALS